MLLTRLDLNFAQHLRRTRANCKTKFLILIGLVFTKCCLRAPVSCAGINRVPGGFSPSPPIFYDTHTTYCYVHKVQSNYYYFFLCVMCVRCDSLRKNGTYLAAVMDGYYFPAHGVCLKRAADVPALDSVHLKFSVWVHFLRQTNAA